MWTFSFTSFPPNLIVYLAIGNSTLYSPTNIFSMQQKVLLNFLFTLYLFQAYFSSNPLQEHPGWMQIFLAIWTSCHGIWSQVKWPCIGLWLTSPATYSAYHSIQLNYPMILMYRQVSFWFCHWAAHQQAVIVEALSIFILFIAHGSALARPQHPWAAQPRSRRRDLWQVFSIVQDTATYGHIIFTHGLLKGEGSWPDAETGA